MATSPRVLLIEISLVLLIEISGSVTEEILLFIGVSFSGIVVLCSDLLLTLHSRVRPGDAWGSKNWGVGIHTTWVGCMQGKHLVLSWHLATVRTIYALILLLPQLGGLQPAGILVYTLT